MITDEGLYAGALVFLIFGALPLLLAWLWERWQARKLARATAEQDAVIDRYAEMVGLRRLSDETIGQLRARVAQVLLYPPPSPFTREVLEAMLRERVPEIGRVVMDSPGPGQLRAALFTADWEPVSQDALARAEAVARDMPITIDVVIYTPRWPRKPVNLS